MNKAFQKGISSILVIVVLAVLVIGAGGYIAWTRYGHLIPLETTDLTSIGERDTTPTTREAPEETPAATSTPAPLKDGPGSYFISQGSNVQGPRIVEATLDPLDPEVGQEQTIQIKTVYEPGVSSVTLVLESDNEIKNLPSPSLIEETGSNAIWETTWTVDDTVLRRYILRIRATGNDGTTSEAGVGPRVP